MVWIRSGGFAGGIRVLTLALLLVSFAAVSATGMADDTVHDAAVSAKPKSAPVKFVWMKPEAALKVLTDRGLKRLKPTASTISWVLADDAKVSEKLADFAKVAAAHHAAAVKVKKLSKETSTDQEALSKAKARYAELKAYSEKPETIPRKIAARFRDEQQLMEALTKELNDQVEMIHTLEPKVLGKFVADMPPPLKAAISDWMLARSKLILAYLPAKPDFVDLDRRYRALADDANVFNALKSLGKKNQLASSAFQQIQKDFVEADATAMTGDVPFYREGSFDSVAAILNETMPIVLKIDAVSPKPLSWMPADMMVKAGVAVDGSEPLAELTITGTAKRVLRCRIVTVPAIRFGKYLVADVKFLALPDDAKDLGIQIAGTELKAYDQRPDQETWLYKFTPKSASAKQ
jgi:hypothetical protein